MTPFDTDWPNVADSIHLHCAFHCRWRTPQCSNSPIADRSVCSCCSAKRDEANFFFIRSNSSDEPSNCSRAEPIRFAFAAQRSAILRRFHSVVRPLVLDCRFPTRRRSSSTNCRRSSIESHRLKTPRLSVTERRLSAFLPASKVRRCCGRSNRLNLSETSSRKGF